MHAQFLLLHKFELRYFLIRLTQSGLISFALERCDRPTANMVTYKHKPGSMLKSVLALASFTSAFVQFLWAYSPMLAFKDVPSIKSSPLSISAFLESLSPILTRGKISSSFGEDPTCHSKNKINGFFYHKSLSIKW